MGIHRPYKVTTWGWYCGIAVRPPPACQHAVRSTVLAPVSKNRFSVGRKAGHSFQNFSIKPVTLDVFIYRDNNKPINVLTGIDYWLDNLICNVPELVMCFHVNGIVQVRCSDFISPDAVVAAGASALNANVYFAETMALNKLRFRCHTAYVGNIRILVATRIQFYR